MAWHKYKAKKTTVDGITFDSKREARRYQELKLLEQAGTICELELQPRFTLQRAFKDNEGNHIRAITYKADFQYIEDGEIIVEDSKGFWTQVFKIKRKMFLFFYPDYYLRIT
jgi:hypothetical protein